MCGESRETRGVVFRIWNTVSQEYVGSYSRSYHMEFDFESEEDAREANVHGMFKQPQFEIHKMERIYNRVL